MYPSIRHATFGALALAASSAFGQVSYPVEGLNPLALAGQDQWSVAGVTPAVNTTVSNTEFSPLAGSTQSIRMFGNGANGRIWRNFGQTLAPGRYLFSFDFKANDGPGADYIMRIALGPDSQPNANQATQVYIGNDMTGSDGTLYSGLRAGNWQNEGGSYSAIFYPNAPLTVDTWYRMDYILDTSAGVLTGPFVQDISGGSKNYLYWIPNDNGFQSDILEGTIYKTIGMMRLGIDAQAGSTEGWYLDNISFKPVTKVVGKVELQDWTLDAAGMSAVVYATGATAADSHLALVDLDAAGNFSAEFPNGDYQIAVSTGHWLRKNVATTTTLAGSQVDIGTVSLINGDIDFDNSVTVFDYGILSDYFDKSSADTDWATVGSNGFAPADADLDGDSAVTVFDYGILSTNFDQSGD